MTVQKLNDLMSEPLNVLNEAVQEEAHRLTRSYKPNGPITCPHCGSGNHRSLSVRPTPFGHDVPDKPDLTARYHKCRQCSAGFWSYTDAQGNSTVNTTSPSKIARLLRLRAERKAQQAKVDNPDTTT